MVHVLSEIPQSELIFPLLRRSIESELSPHMNHQALQRVILGDVASCDLLAMKLPNLWWNEAAGSLPGRGSRFGVYLSIAMRCWIHTSGDSSPGCGTDHNRTDSSNGKRLATMRDWKTSFMYKLRRACRGVTSGSQADQWDRHQQQ